MRETRDRWAGMTKGFLCYFEPLFKAIGVTLVAVFALAAFYTLLVVIVRG